MTEHRERLKSAIEEALRNFAFLDLELRPATDPTPEAWPLCATVICNRGNGLALMLATKRELAREAAACLAGSPSPPEEHLGDIVSEMVNILAGTAYEILHEGRRPLSIGIPYLLPQANVLRLWEQTPEDLRYQLCDETGPQGLLLLVPPATDGARNP